MGKTAQLEQAQDERIVIVETRVSQVSVAEQDVDDEAEHHDGIAIGARRLELPEALLQAGAEVKASKKSLEQDQPRAGGELLVFEAELGESAGFTLNLLSAKLHGGDLQGTYRFLADRLYPKQVAFFHQMATASNLTCGEVPTDLSEKGKRPSFQASLRP